MCRVIAWPRSLRLSLAADGQLTVTSQGETASQPTSLPALLEAYPDVRFVVQLTEPSLQSLAALLQAVDSQVARGRVLAVVDDQQLVDTLRGQAPVLVTAMTAAETDFVPADQSAAVDAILPAGCPGAAAAGPPVQSTNCRCHSSGVAVLVISSAADGDVQRLIDQGADSVVAQ